MAFFPDMERAMILDGEGGASRSTRVVKGIVEN